MATVVEFEGADSAINVGDSISVHADTLIANPGRRKTLVLGNPDASATVWIKLAATGAADGQGIPIFPKTGLVLNDWWGAVCAACSGTVSIGRAEF